MILSRRTLIAAASTLPLVGARAQATKPTLKIGCLTDLSGPYKDLAGPGAIAAIHQALADFGISDKGFNVEVLSADHQNKPDVGATVVRQWFDRDGVDLVLEVANSGVALAVAGIAKEKNAVAGIAKEKNKAYINTGAATSDLTGASCNANTIHWVYDTYMLAQSTGGAMVKAGGTSWYFITADYAFGHALQRDTTSFVTAAEGKVVGSIAYPFPGTTDFSSYLIGAQASGANVLGLANAGTDLINSIKQAKEFGIKMQLAGLLLFLTDVHSLGLETAQGIVLTDSFYWDMNDRSRAFSNRIAPAMKGCAPNHGTGWRLLSRAALSESRRGDGAGAGQARWCGNDRAPQGDADRRRLLRSRLNPRRWTQDPPGLSVGGQEAVRKQGAVGLLQAARYHPGRSGVPSAGQRRLPPGQSLTIRIQK